MPIVLLAQLNRLVEARPSKTPMLSDLRDSGSIEQDAYKVLMLERPEHYNMEYFYQNGNRSKMPAKNRIGILIKKNRGGSLGGVIMKWDGGNSLITEVAENGGLY